jgi:hypothetical protein
MSTVPEIIAARQMGLPCFAISIITDLGVPGKIVKVTHEDVQSVAQVAEPKMTLIMKELGDLYYKLRSDNHQKSHIYVNILTFTSSLSYQEVIKYLNKNLLPWKRTE